MKKYILAVDQSTQGTKALLFDKNGDLVRRADRSHRQIISEIGWVSHDPMEIYQNTLTVVREVIERAGINKEEIAGFGLTNQRETSVAWNKKTGEPVADAIVWQCARAQSICERIEKSGAAAAVWQKSGMMLSPYYPAAKFAWLIENIPEASRLMEEDQLALGTIDTWLLYKLTGGRAFKTEYANASRTQLLNLETLTWDPELLSVFGLRSSCLPTICDSNSIFDETDFDGFLDRPIPIASMLGDSHASLYGHGCLRKGMVKTTFGTGSSVMMNIGDKAVFSKHGVVTSLAWGIDGHVSYVLEGNINYSAAVISWLKNNLELIASASETEELARRANPKDTTYFVPAFTGLGAPHWVTDCQAMICGMTPATGKAEFVKAALESIGYQIADVIEVMKDDTGIRLEKLCVDGGASRNTYLTQFQSDVIELPLSVSAVEEVSAFGVALLAGQKLGMYDDYVLTSRKRIEYVPNEDPESVRAMRQRRDGWKDAVRRCIR